ncbi:uncharacterized protein LACBIDRAFT_295708 [Laccaria bicolor S238N-H82]|uniref:Predicted protein n=1 Tax=Laccaria bicolor (strain S238N-H82 / ATCC MYA-4686) TaxID=486041 RepID=B0DXG0_LACBS|nr:uncharacterized protein LACBIDRAFT_295708 [Laccaria bicolor S238N-H82]EDR00615.1 predicted protein [Laccaria bicolor S238N-H82]|eukprot:XP_001888624.1 predicted protein [Laccaria bicolor S238N-H82]
MSFVPIKGNRILLLAKYWDWPDFDSKGIKSSSLHLSIHEIRSDLRVGSALWSFNGSVDGRFDIRHLELIKSTENELGITFWAPFDNHWKLFDVSTTETNTSNDFPLIESGRIDFDLKLKSKPEDDENLVILSPDMHILLNVDLENGRHNETIDIHYLDSGGTSFSFITCLSIPVAETEFSPEFAFSADGSTFAVSMEHGGVFVWDIRSKVPLQTYMEFPGPPEYSSQPRRFPHFRSGNLGKEILVFAEYDRDSPSAIIHVIDATSFEMEERLILKNEHGDWSSLFFDPCGGTLYAELHGTIYEWDLQKKEPGPEWWIGEE